MCSFVETIDSILVFTSEPKPCNIGDYYRKLTIRYIYGAYSSDGQLYTKGLWIKSYALLSSKPQVYWSTVQRLWVTPHVFSEFGVTKKETKMHVKTLAWVWF